MQSEPNEPAPRKLYYVEGHFDQRTYYTAWIEADSKSEAQDVAEMIDHHDAISFLREVKGYVETDAECFSADHYRAIAVDSTKDHLVMPDHAETNHAN
jgi:hypothetical protein